MDKNPGSAPEQAAFTSFLESNAVQAIWKHPSEHNGFTIAKYSAAAGERPDTKTGHVLLGVWCGGGPVECRNRDGSYSPQRKEHGPLNLYPSGLVPGSRRIRSSDFILIGIEPNRIMRVNEEMGHGEDLEIGLRLRFHDSILRQLVLALAHEARHGFMLGSLFAEHIVHALTVRILRLSSSTEPRPNKVVSALPPALLKKVVAKIHADSSDVGLDSLARESGYSKSHFLRMFYASTGYTPHHYLMRIRVEKARSMLNQNINMIDVASLCGFSSQSHMSKAFRRLCGQTPSEFRRASLAVFHPGNSAQNEIRSTSLPAASCNEAHTKISTLH